MLSAALKVCDRVGIKEVLVSCDKSNPASAGVIKNCGGILKYETYSAHYGEILQMYVINRQDLSGWLYRTDSQESGEQTGPASP